MRWSGVYPAVAGYGFRRYATYRVATVTGVFTNTIFGFILSYAFIALWTERPQLGGYEQAQALTFVWVAQALIGGVALMGGSFMEELQERIRSGDVAIDLYRPVDLQLWWLAADLGRAAFQVVARGVVPMVVGALAFDLALPADPWVWLSFLLAVWGAVLIGFGVRYMGALAVFWLMDGAGVNLMVMLLGTFCSGMLLPLTVFPGWLGSVLQALPWAGMVQVPADVLLGRYSGWALLGALAFQAVWALVLLGAGRVLQAAATRKVVVQGG